MTVPGGLGRAPTPRARGNRRRRAVVALAAFVGWVLLLHGGFLLTLDYGPPRLRDPEYGRRLEAVQARTRENPGRPLVLALGSSRTAMGLRPDVLEEAGGDPARPLVMNFALAGSGPVMELLAYRRARADGVEPAAVLVEYWPAFLREDGVYHEEARFDVTRLRLVDRAVVREFFRDPDATERAMREQRLNPWFGHRKSVVTQTAPRWLPANQRNNGVWETIDGWGWLPGRKSATAEERARAITQAGQYYLPLFARYEVSKVADRAMRQLLTECRQDGVPVALMYLPEAAAFRAMMTPEAMRLADDHLRRLCEEENVPLIDARGWVPDEELPDGFHLTWGGAELFTRRLAEAVEQTFPQLRPK